MKALHQVAPLVQGVLPSIVLLVMGIIIIKGSQSMIDALNLALCDSTSSTLISVCGNNLGCKGSGQGLDWCNCYGAGSGLDAAGVAVSCNGAGGTVVSDCSL